MTKLPYIICLSFLLGVVAVLFLISIQPRTPPIMFMPEYTSTDFDIEVHLIPPEDIDEICRTFNDDTKSAEERPYRYAACARLIPSQHRCLVYVPEPPPFQELSNQYVNSWGHELIHCVYGSFHD